MKKLPVFYGTGRDPVGVMTKAGAVRYGERMMPADLKRAGFAVSVFRADAAINGADFYRINFGKACGVTV